MGSKAMAIVVRQALNIIKKHVEFDLEYAEARSVWFDIYILLRTVPAVLFSCEAF
jgi:lipopolysaccharide/colanic/teichoic acid biosynthesis glycosyltransferase